MKITGSEALNEVNKRFILSTHRNGMEQVMKDYNLVVAFRAAGQYTLEKLKYDAAAKPHSVLEKSIKPVELELEDRFADIPLEDFAREIKGESLLIGAKRFLCGLVGHRNEKGELTGVYLSEDGKKYFSDLNIELAENENGAIYASFSDTKDLIEQISTILAEREQLPFYAKYFVTGDYDLHEIQIIGIDGKLTHVDTDSPEEADILKLLSLGSFGQYEGKVIDKSGFVPSERSPIQHGAQDNYLVHMFEKERDRKMVPKVLIPDPDLAIFNGCTGKWIVFDNKTESNRIYDEIKAILTQVKDLKEYYKKFGGELPAHWQLDNEHIQEGIMYFFDITPDEYNEIMFKQTETSDVNI